MDKNSYMVEIKKDTEPDSFMEELVSGNPPGLLVFLTDLNGYIIIATNVPAKRYLAEASTGSDLSLESILHPQESDLYYQHLEECEKLEENEEKIIELRIKSPQDSWELYSFRHRVFLKNNTRFFLATAIKAGDNNNSEKNSILKGLPSTNEKYTTLVNSLDEGYFTLEILVDLNNKPFDFLILEANQAFENQSGYRNPIGKTIGELTKTSDWIDVFQEIASSGISKRFEQKAKENWFNVYAFQIDPQNRNQLGVLFSNITREKVAEEKLKKVNESLEEKVMKRTEQLKRNADLLQAIFDITNEGIIVFKPIYTDKELIDFQYLKVNKVIAEQYNNDHLPGCSYLKINSDAKEIGVFQKMETSMRTGETKDFEILYDQRGFNNWYRITIRPLNDLLIVLMEDITQQKLEARRLRDNVRFKKHLTRASPDIIMIFNLYDENIRYLNRDMALVPGMRKRDILGKKLPEIVSFIHPKDREKAMEFHKKLIQATDKDILEFEFRLRSSKGTYQWYNALGKVFMRNKNAKVYEYMLLLRNIDKQIETQKALLIAEKLSIKGEIARTLAHELRNPMASIGMASDILSQQLPEEKEEKLQKYVGIIKRSTKVLNNLVSELLTSSNYSPAVREKICLAITLEESLRQAKDRIYLSGIKLIKNYKGNYYINGDEEKLKIALLNIIVNASEAMEPDEGVLEMGITKLDENYTLTITDNGCGLYPEQLEKLFDAFYSQRQDGLGIGLSSVKNILEEHDARIEVESEINKGTTFHLTFLCYED